MRALIELDLVIIPRGGGTGYTGGAVPLDANSAVINTEKLDKHRGVEFVELAGLDGKHPIIHCGAGRGNAAGGRNRASGGLGVRRRSDFCRRFLRGR